MLKVYLAASWSRKTEIQAIANRISTYVDIVSTWFNELEGPHGALGGYDTAYLAALAFRDAAQIQQSQALVFFANDPKVPHIGGGRNVELGMALALGKFVFLVGEPEHCFAHLPQIKRFVNTDDMIAYFKAFAQGLSR